MSKGSYEYSVKVAFVDADGKQGVVTYTVTRSTPILDPGVDLREQFSITERDKGRVVAAMFDLRESA
jgi:hypothetical protein